MSKLLLTLACAFIGWGLLCEQAAKALIRRAKEIEGL